MLGLAKEVGLVGGREIEEVNELVVRMRGVEEVAFVVLDRVQAQLAQPALQPRLEHRHLCGRHANAELARDQRGEPRKPTAIELARVHATRYSPDGSSGGTAASSPSVKNL